MRKNRNVSALLIIVVTAITTFSQTVYGQEDQDAGREWNIYISPGWIVSTKETFRENYDQILLFGESGPPLAIAIGAQVFLNEWESLYLEVRSIQYQPLEPPFGTSELNLTLAVTPLVIGYRYYYYRTDDSGIRAYANAGIGGYWARASIENVMFRANEAEDYFGIGINGGGGIDFSISSISFLGVGINYDFTRIENPESGGLGDVGGLLFFARYSLSL